MEIGGLGQGKLRSEFQFLVKKGDGFRVNSKDIISDILRINNRFSLKNHNILFDALKNNKIKISCYKGIKRMLSTLRMRGVKIGLLTNGVPEIQKNKLECLKILNCFDEIIYAKNTGFEKPNSKPFSMIIKKIKIKPKSILFAGDNLKNDIIPAIKAGMDGLLVDHYEGRNNTSEYKVTKTNLLASDIQKL